MPPALNKVATKNVASKNPDLYPDDRFPPRWVLVTRRGVLLGYVWFRFTGFRRVEYHPFHLVRPDLTEITTIPRKGHSDPLFSYAVDALVDYHDTVMVLTGE